MKNRLKFLSVTLYIKLLLLGHSQYTEIWNNEMGPTDEGWECNEPADCEYNSSSAMCLSSGDEVCIQTTTSTATDNWVGKSADISSYSLQSLQFEFWVNAKNVIPPDYCQVWVRYDSGAWLKQGDYHDDFERQFTLNLPDPQSATTISIKLQTHRESTNNPRCFWDHPNILRGITPQPTDSPSRPPTDAPTTSQPTVSPTDPSTTSEPSQSPTLYPSKTPTKAPIQTPSKSPTEQPPLKSTINPTNTEAETEVNEEKDSNVDDDTVYGVDTLSLILALCAIWLCVLLVACCLIISVKNKKKLRIFIDNVLNISAEEPQTDKQIVVAEPRDIQGSEKNVKEISESQKEPKMENHPKNLQMAVPSKKSSKQGSNNTITAGAINAQLVLKGSAIATRGNQD